MSRPHLPTSRLHLAHQVEEVLGDVKGVVVEDNTFSVSVHYRMVAEGEDRERVNEKISYYESSWWHRTANLLKADAAPAVASSSWFGSYGSSWFGSAEAPAAAEPRRQTIG